MIAKPYVMVGSSIGSCASRPTARLNPAGTFVQLIVYASRNASSTATSADAADTASELVIERENSGRDSTAA
ncbi:hypothetical protein KIH79_03535 [Bifidobacterium sp. 82T10]|uniref:Uncharacterized protein n=1 Tax=Bifidobacterium miconis TaxID=2834435 RepID=A0ABS6WDB6_9BIFI|nr:hypothetical protein [Bifidobacterium miconis]MBW3092039.1 hypothetical protein [Bifidobacterium miconis]